MTVITSREAYDVGVLLCEDFDRKKAKEKAMNQLKEPKPKPEVKDPTRTVTDIDYEKHEQTVKELERQEKEEEFLRKKQEASTWCTLDHEHGPQCRQPIHGCSHDHQKEWAIYEKTTEEKIRGADRFRQEGNEAFRKHNYGLAAVHYRKALLQFDYTFAEGPQEEKMMEDVKLPCLLNLAACKCQQEEWDEVLTQCRLALELNPRSVKAYYRTGQAHIARDNFDLAKDALLSAYEVEPNNPEVRAMLKKLKVNMEHYKAKSKEVCKAMASSATEAADEEPVANVEQSGAASGSSTSPPAATSAEGVCEASEAAESAGAAADSAAEAAEVAEVAAVATEASCAAAATALDKAATLAGDEAVSSSSGLRHRSGGRETSKSPGDDDEEADEDDAVLLASQKKLLDCIFIVAAVLGVVSLGGVAAYLSGGLDAG